MIKFLSKTETGAGRTKRSVQSSGEGLYCAFGKRLFDLAVIIPALVILAPVFFLIALLVRIRLGSPVLFCQERPGLKGKPFVMLKFRTMTDARDEIGELLPDEERTHPFGLLLRRTSLDELPELLNVLKGEMSLVGPRPLLMRYLPRYTPEQMRRHDALPGITGLAQVNGRNNLPWDQKFVMDVAYVEQCSFWLDLKILLMTVCAVTAADGVSAPSHFSSPEFMGTASARSDQEDAI
jgi:sugar transferase EpsL